MQPIIKKALRSAVPISPKLDLDIVPSDYVFTVQYYKNGGAERVVNNYISALRAIKPDLKISILATDFDDDATWLEGIPADIQFINLSPLSASLPRYLRARLLQQALKILSPRTVHIVNSKVALNLVAKLNSKTSPFRTYLSLFNSDYSPSGRLRTYYKELKPASKNITRIFTDNSTVVSEAITATGIKKPHFKVHYQPIIAQVQTPHSLPKTGKIRILWASRVSLQKRPDILTEIARQLPSDKFSISVYGALSTPYDAQYFHGIPALRYIEPYASFINLPTQNFDIFLYTSQADGLPNTLLEATAAGLPIVAPNVGGVGEIINTDTGFLVKDFADVDSYVSILNGFYRDRPDLRPKILAAQHILSDRHSQTIFIKAVKSDIIL